MTESADVVVTVPKSFGWENWIEEGDPAGEPWSGEEWHFYLGGAKPIQTKPGARVYVVHNGQLRGYAPLVRIEDAGRGWAFVRRGGAVALTIPAPILGFRGWRYRWWSREAEVSFPEWRTP